MLRATCTAVRDYMAQKHPFALLAQTAFNNSSRRCVSCVYSTCPTNVRLENDSMSTASSVVPACACIDAEAQIAAGTGGGFVGICST